MERKREEKKRRRKKEERIKEEENLGLELMFRNFVRPEKISIF